MQGAGAGEPKGSRGCEPCYLEGRMTAAGFFPLVRVRDTEAELWLRTMPMCEFHFASHIRNEKAEALDSWNRNNT
jgi:hypothetical protein